jgi:hypothetical protein
MASTRRVFAAATTALAAVALSACGEDDFENEPRPASPIELGALINDRAVKVSPSRADQVGAGLASIVISNQSAENASLVLEGPTDGASDPVPAGGTGSMRIELEEGEYVVAAGDGVDARESTLRVGAPRESAQNELLLP